MRGLIFVVLFSGRLAQAQFVFPVLPPPPQPVVLLWGEHWREVSFKYEGGLQYHWGGRNLFVDPEGVHWVSGEKEMRRSKLRFVEPFDAFGRRIPKAIADFPGAERHTSQRHFNHDGSWYGKSKASVGNRTWFPTWATDGKTTHLVWVEELPTPKMAPQVPQTPTPDPAFESKSGKASTPAPSGRLSRVVLK
jgi:hypothetical protein